MKITRLTIAGFGPYKNEQHVDFEAFDADGLFLITGKTGAGKSSILDAICFALYGSIPRYDAAQPQLRSDYCEPNDPTSVTLEFTVNDVDYRVTRSPEYEKPKSRGSGTTSKKATATLELRSGDQWRGIAALPRDVGHELGRILGLTKDQFLQVILLAQNRFQDFLRAKNDERQDVLRTLFGTRRFERVEAELIERRRVLSEQLSGSTDLLAQHAARVAALLVLDETPAVPAPEWFDSALGSLGAQRDAAITASAAADAEYTAADAAHRAAETTRTLQRRRDDAAARVEALELTRPGIDADRAELDAGRRATNLRSHLVARDATAAETSAAVSAEGEALAAYLALVPVGDVSTGDLAAAIDDITRQLGTLDDVIADERMLAEFDSTLVALRAHLDDVDGRLQRAELRLTELPAQLDATGSRLDGLRILAAREAEATERVQRVSAALAAAGTAAELDVTYGTALVAATVASGENAAAATRVHELMERRLAGHASELAATLVDGDPCAVCGSITHPAPAVGDGEPVTTGDIDAALAAGERYGQAADAAHLVAGELATRLAEATALAAGRAVAEWEAELAAAGTERAAARAAAEEIATLELARGLLRVELASAASDVAELRAATASATAELATVTGQRAAVENRVSAQRGAHASVGDRVESLRRVLAAANRLSDAAAGTHTAQKLLAAAAATVTAQLAEHGLNAEADALEALRSPERLAELEARISDHDADSAVARAVLAEKELVGVPLEPVAVAPLAELLASRKSARDDAISASTDLAARFEQLSTVVVSARQQQGTSARLRGEYDQVRELASVVQGMEPNEKRMRLETYVLAARLEEIVAAANARLRTMTGGRFALEHDDAVQYRGARSGLGLAIRDEYTGRARATHSLSGGETFLASLALALGLAEVVTNQAGGITLDTLFIDEGFGSLDSDTLEIAMSTLDSLRAGGRTIGLISHVDTMKEQIPAKLRIVVADRGFSEIEVARAQQG